jgi:hypothetical protein
MSGVAQLPGEPARDLTDIAVRRADWPSPRIEMRQRTDIELSRRGLEGLRGRLTSTLPERVWGRGLRRSRPGRAKRAR